MMAVGFRQRPSASINQKSQFENRNSLHFLDFDLAEVNFCTFRLEADHALGQLALAGTDLRAVDLGGDGAIFLANNLGGVPVAHGLGGLVFGLLIKRSFTLALEE